MIFYPAGSVVLLEQGGDLEAAIGPANIDVITDAEVTASSASILSS